jgi:hypothetical protein
MSHFENRHEFVSAIALLVACTFSSACSTWHTTPLEPQQFSAEESPELARLTFRDGTRLTARHPVLVRDSLVWVHGSGAAPQDSARSAFPASSIQQVEVNRFNAGRTILLLGVLGGAIYAVARAFANLSFSGN